MKKLLAVFAVALMIVTTLPEADAAARFGGGASFGRSAPTLTRKAPAAAPQQNFGRQQQQAAPKAATPNPAAAAKPASPWRGMLMGAAAALGIAGLLSALGLGEGAAQFVMMLLLAVAIFFVVRLLAGFFLAKKMQGAAGQGQGAAAQQKMQDLFSRMNEQRAEPAAPRQQPVASAASAMADMPAASGSVMDTFATTAAVANGELEIPEGFDKAGFERVAKENFIKLQKAWDTGNVVEISDFTTNDLFITVTHQLRERGNVKQTSEVVDLTAKFLGLTTEGEEYVAVVEFTGAMKYSGEFETVHERWVLTRPTNEKEGWLLAGIEQVQDPVAGHA